MRVSRDPVSSRERHTLRERERERESVAGSDLAPLVLKTVIRLVDVEDLEDLRFDLAASAFAALLGETDWFVFCKTDFNLSGSRLPCFSLVTKTRPFRFLARDVEELEEWLAVVSRALSTRHTKERASAPSKHLWRGEPLF